MQNLNSPNHHLTTPRLNLSVQRIHLLALKLQTLKMQETTGTQARSVQTTFATTQFQTNYPDKTTLAHTVFGNM